MYIGTQKILKEEPLKDKVKVTLESSPLDGIEGNEEVVYNKEVLDRLKTEKLNKDLTELRNIRCESTIGQILMVFLNNNVRIEDFEHILRGVHHTMNQAQLQKEREMYGNHETKRTIGQFADQLLNK